MSEVATADVQPCRGEEMLVTAVNEGTEPCRVTSYPAVVLDWDVDNTALPHSKKDNPGGEEHITPRWDEADVLNRSTQTPYRL